MKLCSLILLFLCAVAAHAQFTLVETGGTFRGDATNLAAASNGATAIGLNELGLGTHFITNINDGTYGNSSSWIGAVDSELSWVGVIFPAPTGIGSFAFGRDNTGLFDDRANDVFTLQYTTDSVTVGTAAGANWVTAVSLVYFNYPPSPALRHLYNLNTSLTGVTAFRLVAFGGLVAGQAIDEIEVYSTSAIPEPSTYAAFAGLAALGLVAWRRRKAAA